MAIRQDDPQYFFMSQFPFSSIYAKICNRGVNRKNKKKLPRKIYKVHTLCLWIARRRVLKRNVISERERARIGFKTFSVLNNIKLNLGSIEVISNGINFRVFREGGGDFV